MGGYYSVPLTWQDLGYVGNVALTKFEGTTPEVMQKLKVGPGFP